MTKEFKKTKEDFVCENCGEEVKGDGYTNHCPRCLWSKHVDIHPGDRQAECGGMMKPVEVTSKAGETDLVHECVRCGYRKTNKASKDDNFEAIIRLSKIDK